jgi:hypothetical protein
MVAHEGEEKNRKCFTARWVVFKGWFPETRIIVNIVHDEDTKLKTKLCGFSPQANYTNRATAACRRS